MTTITLEMGDEQASRLTQEAQRRGVSIAELLLDGVRDLIEPGGQHIGPCSDAEFEAATDHVLQKNAELYRRLAG